MLGRYTLAVLLLLALSNPARAVDSVRSEGRHSDQSVAGGMRFRQYPGFNADNFYDKRGFIATCVQAATSAKNSICQIYNPVGSGQYVFLDLIRCWHTSGSTNDPYMPQNTPRTTLVGGGTNAFIGSANTSVGQIYKDAISALPPVSGAIDQPVVAAVPANNIPFASNVPGLPPGTGVEVESLTQNIGLNCEFWWHEIIAQ